MLSKLNIYILSLFVLLCLSCSNEKDVDAHALGVVETYDDFPGCKYTPDTIPIGKFIVEFLDDAVSDTCPASFRMAAYNLTENGGKTLLDVSVAQLYCNGKAVKGNQFVVKNDKPSTEIELSIVLNKDAEDAEYTFSVEVMDEGRDLEKIVDEDDKMINELCEKFVVKKDTIVNPLKKNLGIALAVLGLCLAVWLFVLRYMFFPRIKVTSLQFEGPGPFFGMYPVKGCYKVVLTCDTKKKQSFFARVFKGKVKYIYNEIWTTDVAFSHFDKNSVSIRVSGTWSCDSFQLEKLNSYEIYSTESPKEKGKITVL